MRKVKLAIWGTSGHACVVYDSVLKSNTFTCCAFIDDVNQDLWGKELFHIPVMGIGYTIDTPLKVAPYGISSVLCAIGVIKP